MAPGGRDSRPAKDRSMEPRGRRRVPLAQLRAADSGCVRRPWTLRGTRYLLSAHRGVFGFVVALNKVHAESVFSRAPSVAAP